LDKKTIIWDNDDTLNNFRRDWLYHHYFKNNEEITYNQLIEKNPYNLVGATKKEVIDSMISFKKNCYEDITINQEILWWFQNYGNNFNHIVLTILSKEVFYESIWSTVKYFGNWIHSYNFITFEENISKVDFINRNFKKIDYFIDDDEKNINEIKRLCPEIECGLIKQPWNNGIKIKEILENLK
jgi:hypothetical protein